MAMHRSLGPIARPSVQPPRVLLTPDWSTPPTQVQMDLKEAMYQARAKQGLWELRCTHATEFGRDTVRLVGDGALPLMALHLDLNGVQTSPATRQAAYLAIVAKFPDAMRRDWVWVFAQFPSWGREEEA
jgi:hypothetical protein